MTEMQQRRPDSGLSRVGSNPAAQLLASVPPPDDRPLMPPSRVSILLSEAAAIDQRIITELMIHEWQVALAGLEFEECATAIRLYRETEQPSDYLRPARVREHVVQLRAHRRIEARITEARRRIAEAERRKAHRSYIGPITEAEFWAEQDTDAALDYERSLAQLGDQMDQAEAASVAKGKSPFEARRQVLRPTEVAVARW